MLRTNPYRVYSSTLVVANGHAVPLCSIAHVSSINLCPHLVSPFPRMGNNIPLANASGYRVEHSYVQRNQRSANKNVATPQRKTIPTSVPIARKDASSSMTARRARM